MLDCLRIKISQYCFIVIITLISYWDNTANNIKHNNLWICVGLLFAGRSMCHNSLNTKNFNFSYVSLTWESHNMTTSTVSMSFRCFYHFWPCKLMRKHAFGWRNTQNLSPFSNGTRLVSMPFQIKTKSARGVLW